MSIEQFFLDFGVEMAPDGSKHKRPGWVNVECPYCEGTFGYHLGFNQESTHFYCWRCGWHPLMQTLSLLVQVPESELKPIIREYEINEITESRNEPTVRIIQTRLQLPSNSGQLLENHRRYMERRGFDPDQIAHQFGIRATGPFSELKVPGRNPIDYRHRIIAPIYWEKQMVSFQARDVTGKDPERYRACPKLMEIIHHKDIIYGLPDAWGDTGICVEGIFDVWRFGRNSFCTFGIEVTMPQIRRMAQTFKRIFVAFDPEKQAQVQARKLMSELRFRGVKVELTPITGWKDPAEMPQAEANYFVRELLTRNF